MKAHTAAKIARHLKEVEESYRQIRQGFSIFSDNGKACSESAKNARPVKLRKEDYTSVTISALTLDKLNSGCILYGKIIVPPLIMKSIMTFVEDGNGCIVLVAVYNALPQNLKSDALISAANALLKEGDLIGIVDPFFKRFADGTEGIRVDNPNNVLTNLNSDSVEHLRNLNQNPNAEQSASGSRPSASALLGASVLLQGLKSRPELNGVRAIVVAELEGGRVSVRLKSGSQAPLSVSVENVTRELEDDGNSRAHASGLSSNDNLAAKTSASRRR
jgi:hypothetical protein